MLHYSNYMYSLPSFGLQETHAFQRDMLAGLLWVLLHPALAFCLLLISAGLVAAVLDSERAQLRAETTTLLALGSGLAVVCMTTQRITHKGLQYRLSSWNKALHLLVNALYKNESYCIYFTYLTH